MSKELYSGTNIYLYVYFFLFTHSQIFGNRIISFAHSILLIHFETVTLRYCFSWSEKQRNNDKYIEIRKCSQAYIAV